MATGQHANDHGGSGQSLGVGVVEYTHGWFFSYENARFSRLHAHNVAVGILFLEKTCHTVECAARARPERCIARLHE